MTIDEESFQLSSLTIDDLIDRLIQWEIVELEPLGEPPPARRGPLRFWDHMVAYLQDRGQLSLQARSNDNPWHCSGVFLLRDRETTLKQVDYT